MISEINFMKGKVKPIAQQRQRPKLPPVEPC
jgi:hypothetical protein